jgi:hypothetical protein
MSAVSFIVDHAELPVVLVEQSKLANLVKVGRRWGIRFGARACAVRRGG